VKLLRKARVLLATYWEEALAYRAESFVWFVGDVVQPLVMVALWLAAYREVDRIGAYTVDAMVSYYVLMLVFRTLLTPHPEWETSRSIREGDFGRHLLRPLPFDVFQLAGEFAWKGVRLFFLTPTVIFLLLWQGERVLAAFGLRWELVPVFLASLVLSFLLSYYLRVAMGMLAFWISQTGGVFELFYVVQSFLSGLIIPLDIMPEAVQAATAFSPFPYFYFFPIQLAQGRLELAQAVQGLAIQAAWLVVSFLLMRLVFTLGVRRFSAYGG
jgi:ABC-2 type transport system permease protein